MPLEPGTYTITSPSLKEGEVIARHAVEDRSGLPKRIISVPSRLAAPFKWQVEHVGGDRYKLSIGGHTAALDNKVFAILQDEPPAEEWKITYQVRPKAYTITRTFGGEGWVVPSGEDNNQIEVRPLIIGPSEPPFFPPNEVFVFIKE